jgi:hypothetical protein
MVDYSNHSHWRIVINDEWAKFGGKAGKLFRGQDRRIEKTEFHRVHPLTAFMTLKEVTIRQTLLPYKPAFRLPAQNVSLRHIEFSPESLYYQTVERIIKGRFVVTYVAEPSAG